MGWEMSPKLEQQQKLMSQSPAETTQAARNPDSAERRKGGREKHPGFPLMCSERPFLSA